MFNLFRLFMFNKHIQAEVAILTRFLIGCTGKMGAKRGSGKKYLFLQN